MGNHYSSDVFWGDSWTWVCLKIGLTTKKCMSNRENDYHPWLACVFLVPYLKTNPINPFRSLLNNYFWGLPTISGVLQPCNWAVCLGNWLTYQCTRLCHEYQACSLKFVVFNQNPPVWWSPNKWCRFAISIIHPNIIRRSVWKLVESPWSMGLF